MSQLYADGRFVDFGPTACVPAGIERRTARLEGTRPAQLRAQVRLLAPARPGVYGMIDQGEQLIYVGKAKNLRVRLHSYFRKKGRPAKAGRMIGLTRSIVWEILPSEFASLLRELELIRRWRPRCNVQGQPLRRRLAFICLGRAPAPHLYLSRTITSRVQAAFGPITAGARAVDAVRRLNDYFRLRDCPQPQEMIFPDQPELFPGVRDPGCLRMEIGACLGPCTGLCVRGDYDAQAKKARAFLTGNDLSLLADLRGRMETAAKAQEFERAAGLRDRWAVLQWLADRLARIRQAQADMSFIYPVAGWDGSTTWHLIHGARPIAAVAKPRDAADGKKAAERIEAVYRHASGLLDGYEHADSMMVVMQWFRKHPGERKNCFPPTAAINGESAARR